MAHLTLPKILNIPEKLLPLVEKFNDYRVFLLEGGRGGAKSQTVARFLLYLNDRYNLRTVCGRETQNTIDESVHRLLSDLIGEFQLNYEIQKATISSRNKDSTFKFIGLREQGRFNIKGLEGTDILWIEEGQAVTKPTMEIVLPTIRKPNSKVIVTMNRHVHNDPAHAMLVNRKDCLHIKINYLENEFCTKELIHEAEICKAQSQKDYEHIWLGQPLDQSEDSLFGLGDFEDGRKGKHELQKGYGIRVAGFDIARYGDDKCAVVVFQQMGALHWEEIHSEEWDKRDLNYTTGRILSITNELNIDRAAVDIDGLGAGPYDTLTKGRNLDYFVGFRNPVIGYQQNPNYGNPRTVNAYKLKEMLGRGHLCVNHPKVQEELLTLKYTFDHNQRRILISKEQMRSKGIKSPNLADSAIMGGSLIGEVKEKQKRQYEPDIPEPAQDESLFGLAGIR